MPWQELTLLLLAICSAALWIRRGVEVRIPSRGSGDAARPRTSDLSSLGAGISWVPFGAIDAFVVFFGWILSSSVLAALLGEWLESSPAAKYLVMSVASIGIVLVFTLIFRAGYPPFRSWCALGAASIADWVFHGLRRCLLILPPLLLIHRALSEIVPYQHSTIEALLEHRDVTTVVSLWISAVVAAPLFEEFLFRVVLLNWLGNLQRLWPKRWDLIVWGRWMVPGLTSTQPTGDYLDGDNKDHGNQGHRAESARHVWFPVMASSLVFGALHWTNGLAMVPLFLLGVFLALLALKTRSLWSCVIVHAGFNAYSMLMVTVQIMTE